jgi:hypothetical protein
MSRFLKHGAISVSELDNASIDDIYVLERKINDV